MEERQHTRLGLYSKDSFQVVKLAFDLENAVMLAGTNKLRWEPYSYKRDGKKIKVFEINSNNFNPCPFIRRDFTNELVSVPAISKAELLKKLELLHSTLIASFFGAITNEEPFFIVNSPLSLQQRKGSVLKKYFEDAIESLISSSWTYTNTQNRILYEEYDINEAKPFSVKMVKDVIDELKSGDTTGRCDDPFEIARKHNLLTAMSELSYILYDGGDETKRDILMRAPVENVAADIKRLSPGFKKDEYSWIHDLNKIIERVNDCYELLRWSPMSIATWFCPKKIY